MDTYGFILLFIGLLLLVVIRKSTNNRAWLLTGAVLGAGIGIIIASVGIYLRLMASLP